jgi:molecular chaperone DnaK
METVQARNGLDALVHSVTKSLGEHGDKIGADEKAKIEAALKDAEELLKQKDAAKDALEAKTEELAKTSQKLGEAMYAQAQAEAAGAAGAAGAGAGHAGGQGGGQAAGDEKVVDAEYTEVKDRK